jgi:uncharacterized protein (DUF488 family)
MKIFTIGFTKKNAEEFFTKIQQPGLVRLIDSRLNNISQLAGFTKKDDLKFFLKEICKIDYIHLPQTAPTKNILDEYKKNGGSWAVYEKQFLDLMESRQIEKTIDKSLFDGGCLLCSEATPHHCHRRLVAEYLQKKWRDVEVVHL